jgi:outer membrane protein assembly factor BamD
MIAKVSANSAAFEAHGRPVQESRLLARVLMIIVFAGFVGACVEKEFDPNNPEKSYGIAKEPYDDGNYEIAITRLGEFKSRFPYSKFAAEAELLIANAQFELDHFTEAALAYEQFVKLHPKHPKVDYAQFRIGQSYWEDAPADIDREQEFTQKAIDEWQKLVQKMPDSTYAKQAKDLISQGKRRIAESIAFIVRFYCKQDLYHACAYRAIQLADEYGEFPDLRIEAVEAAVKALDKVADAKAKDPTSDKNLYFKTMTESEIRARADGFRKLLADYKATNQSQK